MVEIKSSALIIRGDRLKERDVVKSLAKIVDIIEKLFSVISYLYQY